MSRDTKGEYNFDNNDVFCQICGIVMNNKDEFVLCPDCLTPFHTSCWNNRGGCGNPECESYVEKSKKNDTLQGRIVSAINEKAKKYLEDCDFENALSSYKKALCYDHSNEEALIGMILADACVTSLENLFLLNVEFERFPMYQEVKGNLSEKTKELFENEIVLRKERKRLDEKQEEEIVLRKERKRLDEKQEKEIQTPQKDLPSQKTKKKTRTIALISAIVAIFISVSIVIGAYLSMQGPSGEDSYFNYEKVSGGIKIVGLMDKTVQEVYIPEKIAGLPVTEIGEDAFYNCTRLKSIEIPNSVTTIGDYAFYNCTGLTSIVIPNSVTAIGNYAFYGCRSLTSITIGSGVTTIGSYVFLGCTGLKEITVPFVGNGSDKTYFGYIFGASSYSNNNSYVPTSLKSVTVLGGKIGNNAFSCCTGLTSVTIPNSVTSIGAAAFWGCTGLTSVTIGSGVTTIGDDAFWGCTGLEEITVPFVGNGSDQTHFGYIFGASSSSDNKSYVPTSLKSVTVLGGKIGNNAFSCCTGLTSVTIGSGVTTIGSYAFVDCTGLTSVEIPNSVTSIGSAAFYNCTGLESVEIPNSVTSIGELTFYNCTDLTIYCEVEDQPGGWDSSWNSSWRSSKLPVFWGYKSLVDSLTYELEGNIYKVIGCDKNARSVIIPDTYNGIPVTIIDNSAFYNCTNLTSVKIPNSVTSIGNSAFFGCTNLISIIIPNSVTTIGDNAFEVCTGLTSVVIPNSVTTIGNNAFLYCSSLTIYCETESKPNGWKTNWNYSNCYVVWNYKNS